MDIVKTGIGIGKTIKNVARFQEIVLVLSKNGLRSLLRKSALTESIIENDNSPADLDLTQPSDDSWKKFAVSLRQSFEELGPSFMKLGQLMATREDLFPRAFIVELRKLQNQAKPILFASAQEVLRQSLQKPWEDVFSSIEENPIGNASIGVVYRAWLKDGSPVVIKIQRPGIDKLIRTDFEIMRFVFQNLEKNSEVLRQLSLSRMIDDFFKAMISELNFLHEALNAQRLRENLNELDQDKIFMIPHIYTEYSSAQILVMEFLQGRPFNTFKNVLEFDVTIVKKLEKSVELFIHTLLAHGFFHADLHGGNFFILENQKIGLIDFGLMGTLSKKNRANLVSILFALLHHDYENLVYEFLEVAEYESIPDTNELIRDLREALSPFVGLSLQQSNMTDLVHAIVTTLLKHRLTLPREWFIIFRALMTLDGTGRSIGLDINVFLILEKELPALMSTILSSQTIKEEALWVGKDLVSSLRLLPKHLNWFIKQSSKRGYSLDVRIQNFSQTFKSIAKSLHFIGISFFASTLVIVGSFSLFSERAPQTISDISPFSWIFWLVGGSLFGWGLWFKK
jgi:ubiquinone biosynthesis protein